MLNLNKLAPRLTINAKLAIAFAFLTVVPLLAVVAVATPIVLDQLRDSAEQTLEYNLDLVHQGVSRSIREADQHLSFIADAFIGDQLTPTPSTDRRRVTELASTFLRVDSSAVLRVRAFDTDGRVRFDAGRLAQPEADASTETHGELFYLWMAENALSEGRLFLPVELRDPEAADDAFGVIPAIAILQSMRDARGSLLGVAVAEVAASELFQSLELATPGLKGAIGLVDMEGRFLYHSERKRDWASLMAAEEVTNLRAEFSPDVAAAILSGLPGEVRTELDEFASFRPIAAVAADGAPLVLYRTVPLAAVNATVRRFLLGASAFGLAVLGVVLWVAVIAARQFTKPIYLLQRAARDLAERGQSRPVVVETNDELEDLARDFTSMATSLVQHRENLETMVAARSRALQETRAELSEIVTHSADAIIGLDVDHRVRLWNNGARDLFGYEDQEAIGEHIDRLIGGAEAQREHESAYIKRMLQERGSVVNLRTVRTPKDGPPFPVGLTQTSFTDEDGNPLGCSLIFRDHRMQHSLEEQMRRSERLAAVSIMAAGLTHELNNPLAILGNRIELMQRDAKRNGAGEQVQKDLAVLGHHVERLRGVTTDLLAFAREDGEQSRRIELDEILARVVRLFQRTFTTKGIDLELTTDGGSHATIGHDNAIETVFVNLLMNAMQAMPQGGSVWVECRGREDDGAFVVVEVRDTGLGIPKDIQKRIFEPFFTTKGDQGGTGLGLAVCRTIVERHGGSISIESGKGTGSSFLVSLPKHGGAV